MNKFSSIALGSILSIAFLSGCGVTEQETQDSAPTAQAQAEPLMDLNTKSIWQTQDVRTGVDMAGYCHRKFGQQFNAAYLGSGNWVCQTDPHNTRSISVVEACTWQQNTSRVVFDQAALAWYCLVPKQVWVPVRVGVDMNSYCKRQYGNDFSSKVIGSTVGDWVCQSSNPNERRPINVKQACLWQQNTSIVGYTDVNNPLSWYCEK